ncbi:MAG: histidinol dehydrogenase [Bacilli bacterium]
MNLCIEKYNQQRLPNRDLFEGREREAKSVDSILEAVKQSGDTALRTLTEQFDGVKLEQIRVTETELQAAIEQLALNERAVIEEAITNIRRYHTKQIQQSWFTTDARGSLLGQQITPLDSVACYVPGGTAPLISSVLMTVIPAQCAGVKRIIMLSPPSRETGKIHRSVLAVAQMLGVEEVYQVGGAQAIAAAAYGTESIAPVDKIVGPGNIYVTLAKRALYGTVDIDLIAGPSELVVLADETARATEVAADLLSQAEHDTLAVAIAVVTSTQLAEDIADQVECQLQTLPRESIARAAWEQFGRIYVVENIAAGIEAVNALAPEHLEVITADPFALLGKIKHAGAVFLGRYSSEPVGDYWAGPNHVLPTSGTARFFGALDVNAFVKRSSIIYYSEEAWRADYEKIAAFARMEQLEAHARAVESRKGNV